MDEVLGAVAVSLRREKVPQTSTMGSANGNQSETFIQVSMLCSICTYNVLLSRFYPDFIQILLGIEICSRFLCIRVDYG